MPRVDRLHAAVTRCLAGVIQRHSGTKVYIEQTIRALSRVVNNQVEHARMDRVFDQNGITTFIDVAIGTPFSSSPGLIAAASARPGEMAKRAEDFERYPHINLVRFVLETTGRPGHHAKKFISSLMKDADHPSLAIRHMVSRPERTAQRLQATTLRSLSQPFFSTHVWWQYAASEWQTWWSSSWQTTPRWLATLGAEHDAQSPGSDQHVSNQSSLTTRCRHSLARTASPSPQQAYIPSRSPL